MDFNDPKITKQEKDDFLRLQIDDQYKEDRKKYGFRPVQRFWKINGYTLQVLNWDALTNDGIFDLYEESLQRTFPQFTLGLFECDRIEKGEWDEDYKRWSDRSYVRCMTTTRGCFSDATEEGLLQEVYKFDKEKEGVSDLIFQYPNTFNEDGTIRKDDGGVAIIEFDPTILEECELVSNAVHTQKGFADKPHSQEEGLRELRKEIGKVCPDDETTQKSAEWITNVRCERFDRDLYSLKESYDSIKGSILQTYHDDKDRKTNRRSRKARGRRIKKNIKQSIAKRGFAV